MLTAWVLYATVRVFMQKWYWVADYHYLTPFYSPCVSNGCDADSSQFGRFLPDSRFLPFAALTLPFLLPVPADLLLLPQGLLPLVLAVAAGLRGGRAARRPTRARRGSR